MRVRRITIAIFAPLAAILVGIGFGHDIISTRLTWSKEISRIVYRRCANCHSGAGPAMPLTTYAQVRPWAKAIKEQVLTRRMPPWGAMRGFRPLRDDPSLTQDEIDRVAQWVEGGAPEGDPRLLPPTPARAPAAGARFRRVRLPEMIIQGMTVAGLAPAAGADDARITAELPDGRIVPLLWLYGYKAAWGRSFLFEEPAALPGGTHIHSDPRIPIDALIATPKPEH